MQHRNGCTCMVHIQWRDLFGNQEIGPPILSHGVMDGQYIKGLTSFVFIKILGRLGLVKMMSVIK